MGQKGIPYWPKNFTAPIVLPQPDRNADRYEAGCICPIGANLACENPLCPRKSVLKSLERK